MWWRDRGKTYPSGCSIEKLADQRRRARQANVTECDEKDGPMQGGRVRREAVIGPAGRGVLR